MLSKGQIVAGRYEIMARVGTGGMADVYKAMDTTLGRNVAIKVLKNEYSDDNSFVDKFRAEASAAAGLEHPNIVNVYDVGAERGFYYIVMEYVEGITLKTYIERKKQLTFKESLSIAIQVARGIQAAHEKGIIHRDIKPLNIMISTEGKVKVTDFGIARAVSANTIHSDVMGSVHYTSPEQARNGFVSNKSDIYSLGIVMYEMVTGRVPFDGESTVEVAIKHLQDDVVSPKVFAKDLPVSMEKIIMKCLQKSADRRYDSMESLLVDLRKALLSPNEDFVTLVTGEVSSKTRVMTDAEVKAIQEKTSPVSSGKKVYIEDDEDDEYDEYDEYSDYDDYDDDKPVASKVDKVVGVMKVVLAIIIALIVIYLVGSYFGFINLKGGLFHKNNTQAEQTVDDEAKEVVMINLENKTIEDATAELEKMGLKLKEGTREASETIEEGKIISQDVKEGENIKEGSTVTVVVSSGKAAPEEIDVPDVTGKSADDGKKTLEDAGFVVSKEFEESGDVEAGKIIRQDPKSGTLTKGSTVVIFISQAEAKEKVPDTVGKSEADAQAALESAGFKFGGASYEFSDSVAEGKVIRQDVAGGKYAAKETTISIVVSKGPEKKTYKCSATINAPSNLPEGATLTSADIELVMSESDSVIESWTGITTFPYTVNKTGIEGAQMGTLCITWHYTDADGNEQSSIQEADVNFKKE